MKSAWSAVVALGLAGCTQAPQQPSKLEQEARTALDLSLNDAASARLRDVKLSVSGLDPKTVIVCGLVNAKNQMGAYSGWHRFFLQRGTKTGLVSPDAAEDSARYDKAAQAVFESVYSSKDCPTTHYAPPSDVRGAVAALAKDRNQR